MERQNDPASDTGRREPVPVGFALDEWAKRFKRTPEQEAAFAERERRLAIHRAEAQRAARLLVLSKALGARYARERVTLEAFSVYDPAQKPVLARISAIGVEIAAFVKSGRSLAMLGPVGTGKDHLAAHLLYRVADAGFSCVYTNGRDLFQRLRGTMDREATESEKRVIDDFVRPDVLLVSDALPPAGELREWHYDVLYRLVDRRYRALRGVWLTANTDNGDAAFSEPVWDRIQHGGEIIECRWTSYREK